MIPRTVRSLLAAPIVASLVVATACSGDDAASAPDAVDLTPTSADDPPDPADDEPVPGDANDQVEPSATEPTTGPGPTEAPGTDDAPEPTTDDATNDSPTEPTEPPSEPTDDAAPGTDDPRFDVLEPRVGTWVVGDAGEIDVDLTADGLVLLDVRAASGWQVSIDEESPDEIEVDFEQGAVEWEIEIEWENGVLEVEIDQDIEPADPGIVTAGIAGTVEFDRGPDGLLLVGVTTEAGWDAAVTEEAPDEIEVRFVNGLAEYEVEIELDDGVIEVEVDFEVEGPFTA